VLFKDWNIAAEYLEGFLGAKVRPSAHSARDEPARNGQPSYPMHQSQHKIVSVSQHGDDGGKPFRIVMQLADRINAQAFLLTKPGADKHVQERSNPAEAEGNSARCRSSHAGQAFSSTSKLSHCPMFKDVHRRCELATCSEGSRRDHRMTFDKNGR